MDESVADRAEAAEVLGVGLGASPGAVRAAWRDAARRHHPDCGGGPSRFRAVADAYRLLAEPVGASPWPAIDELPEGALRLELAELPGIAWRGIASDADRTITPQFFSVLEHDAWSSMVIDDD